jgi:hypothetical protein
MGELHHRPAPPSSPDRGTPDRAAPDRAAHRGRATDSRVPAPVTGLRPHPDGPPSETRHARTPRSDLRGVESVPPDDTPRDPADLRKENADLRAELADLKSQRAADKAEFTARLHALESRFEAHLSRQERPGADASTRSADHVDAADTAAASKADARTLTGDTRGEKTAEPKWRRRGPSDAALGFVSSTAATGLAELAVHLPPTAHTATLSAGLFGMAVSGVAWIRNRREARNADRSSG